AVVAVIEIEARRGIASDVNVGPAIVIEIGRYRGHAVTASCLCNARSFADVLKVPFTVVVKKIATAWDQSARAAFHRHAFPVAVRGGTWFWKRVQIERQVVGDEKIQMAVAIIIDPGAAGPPQLRRLDKACFFRHVGECAIPVVAVEDVLAPVSDEEVFEAIVVVVANGNGARPSFANKPGLFGDIGESAVAVVLIKAIGRALRRALQASAVECENIEPTVVVVIEKRDAAADHLQDVILLVGIPVDVRCRESGLIRDIGEMCQERNAGRLPARGGGDTTRSISLSECGHGEEIKKLAA